MPKLLLAILSAFLSVSPAASVGAPQLEASPTTSNNVQLFPIDPKSVIPGTISYGLNNVNEQCRAQPTNPWCQPKAHRTTTLDAYRLNVISRQVFKNFVYTSDVVDKWRVHSPEVIKGESWKGDCDDLASTTLDMMIRAGHPMNKLWMVIVDSSNTGYLDHMVAMAQDDDGHYWIVGDTSKRNVYPAELITYKVLAIARMDTVKFWFNPKGVGIFPQDAL
jgi:predicted transglutaminase-like cysteine proteinase